MSKQRLETCPSFTASWTPYQYCPQCKTRFSGPGWDIEVQGQSEDVERVAGTLLARIGEAQNQKGEQARHSAAYGKDSSMEQVKILRIVVASPGDVQAERDLLPSVIEELNRGIAGERGLHLVLSRWETDSHPGFHPDGPQGLIDSILEITDCELLIGVFWKRFGTLTVDGKTGTEHEISIACESWRKTGKPQIFIYFNQSSYSPKSKEETDQWGQVFEFKRNFPKEGFWWPYDGEREFERLVRQHLTRYIRKLPKPSEASDSLDFSVKQAFYTEQRQAIIISVGIANPSPQPNTIKEVSITMEGKSYMPSFPGWDLIGYRWLAGQGVRIEPWDFIPGAWFFGAGFGGQPIKLASRTPISLRVMPLRGNPLELSLEVIPYSEMLGNPEIT